MVDPVIVNVLVGEAVGAAGLSRTILLFMNTADVFL